VKLFHQAKIGLFFLLAIMIFSACDTGSSSSGSTSTSDVPDTYTMSVLPSKFALDIPASITGSSTPSAASYDARAVSARAVGDQSQGCQTLKGFTQVFSGFSPISAMMAILADGAVSQNKALLSDGLQHTVTVTFTQEMVDAMSSVMGGGTVDASDMSQAIGQPMTLTVTYSINNEVPYTNKVIMSMDGGGATQTSTIEWNVAKTESRLTMVSGADGAIVFSYDDTAKLMSLDFSNSSMGTIEMSLQTQAAGGVLIYCMMVDTTGNAFRLEGYADDLGGYVKQTMTAADFTAFTSEEYFGASGAITATNADYTSQYAGGDLEGLQEANSFTMATTAADGEYLAYTSGPNTSLDTIDPTKIIGYAKVTSGTLVIEDIGGDAYSTLETAGTFYLYKATSAFFSSSVPTFNPTSVTVTH